MKKNQLIYIILLYNKIKFQKKDFIDYKHNYILEYLNTIKFYSKIINIITTK